MTYWVPDPPHLIILFAAPGREFIRRFDNMPIEQRSLIFQLIENGMTSNEDALVAAVATRMIEAIYSKAYKDTELLKKLNQILVRRQKVISMLGQILIRSHALWAIQNQWARLALIASRPNTTPRHKAYAKFYMNYFVNELTALDRQTISECLSAAEQESFFPEWEFEILFGISRIQLSYVRKKWPEVDFENPNVGAAVIGALNHLLGYPSKHDAHWKETISVSPNIIKLVLEKLLSSGL